MDETPDSTAPEKRPSGCFKWTALAIVGAVAIISLTGLKACSMAVTGLDKAVDVIASLPEKFQSGQISQTFRERLNSIAPTHGDILEVAVAEREETVTRSDMKNVLFNMVYIGTTTSEIRVPVVFRYHVKLSDDWKVGGRGSTCVVVAPKIRATHPPAIRTEKMETKSTAGWMRFNAAKNLADLQKSLTPAMSERAGNSTHVDEVREASRRAVAEFVKNWLVSENQWRQQGFTDIVIVFADEPAARDLENAATQKPALKLLP